MDDTAKQLRELEARVDALTATLPGPQTNGVRVILRSISGLLLACRWQIEDRPEAAVPAHFAPGDHE